MPLERNLILLAISLLLIACSTTPKSIIKEEVIKREIDVPQIIGQVKLEPIDSVISYGSIDDSTLAGELYLDKAKDLVTYYLKPKIEIIDTIKIIEREINTLQPIIEVLTPIEKIILFSMLGLFFTATIWLRIRSKR